MRLKVICNNCGIKWVRVVNSGTSVEYNYDIQILCPNCNSNDYSYQATENINKQFDNLRKAK